MITLHFKKCQVIRQTRDSITTVFWDGKRVLASFVYDESTRRYAKEMGYGFSVMQMHLEHDLSHTIVSEARSLDYSPTLYYVAGGPFVPDDQRLHEEGLVTTFQTYSNTGRWDSRLNEIPDLELNIHKLQRCSAALRAYGY